MNPRLGENDGTPFAVLFIVSLFDASFKRFILHPKWYAQDQKTADL
jgi:hypothetical protein